MDGKISAGHSLYMANFYNIYGLISQLLHANVLEHVIFPDYKETEQWPTKISQRVGVRNQVEEQHIFLSQQNLKMLWVTKLTGEVKWWRQKLQYKKYMLGVEWHDQMLSYYPVVRKQCSSTKEQECTYSNNEVACTQFALWILWGGITHCIT